MYIELKINDGRVDFFLEYLHSLKEGIIEKIEIKQDTKPSFVVSSIEEVRKRIEKAEKNGNYTPHDIFWDEMGIK